MKITKKAIAMIIALVIAAVSIISMNLTAFAAGTGSSFTISNISSTVELHHAITPEETYTYTLTPGGNIDSMNVQAGPELISCEMTSASGMLASADFGNTPGFFHYILKQNAGSVLGETYSAAEYDIIVQYGWNAGQTSLGVINVMCYQTKDDAGRNLPQYDLSQTQKKTPVFNNKVIGSYLYIYKYVQGNVGDKDKEFQFTLTVEPTEGYPAGTIFHGVFEKTNERITLEIGRPCVFTLSDGDLNGEDWSMSFTDLPFGAQYTISEADYSSQGYETRIHVSDSENVENELSDNTLSAVLKESTSIEFYNTREIIDTGIFEDYSSITTVIILSIIALCALVLIKKQCAMQYK